MVFTPTAILEKVQAVFHLSVAADITQQFRNGHLIEVEAADVVLRVTRNSYATGTAQLSIHAQCDATASQLEGFANVRGFV